MCPLRYIVFAVSAIVALIVLFWGQSSPEKLENAKLSNDNDDSKEKLLNEGSNETSSSSKEISSGKLQNESKRSTRPIDFFTGRYLYDKYREYRGII